MEPGTGQGGVNEQTWVVDADAGSLCSGGGEWKIRGLGMGKRRRRPRATSVSRQQQTCPFPEPRTALAPCLALLWSLPGPGPWRTAVAGQAGEEGEARTSHSYCDSPQHSFSCSAKKKEKVKEMGRGLVMLEGIWLPAAFILIVSILPLYFSCPFRTQSG